MRIRELTNDGEELVDIALSVARGQLSVITPHGEGMAPVLPTAKERLQAVAWLADRGFGKAEQPVELSADGGPVTVTLKVYGPGDE